MSTASQRPAKKAKVNAEGKAVARDQKVALITGITGQDGSYLAEFLLKKVRCALLRPSRWVLD